MHKQQRLISIGGLWELHRRAESQKMERIGAASEEKMINTYYSVWGLCRLISPPSLAINIVLSLNLKKIKNLLTSYCYIPFLYFSSFLIYFFLVHIHILKNPRVNALAFIFSQFLLQNLSFAIAQNVLPIQPHIVLSHKLKCVCLQLFVIE